MLAVVLIRVFIRAVSTSAELHYQAPARQKLLFVPQYTEEAGCWLFFFHEFRHGDGLLCQNSAVGYVTL